MTIWENVCNIIIKRFNSELMYNKKYLKDEKIFNTKESFQCFYIPAILFDSVYRKDGNYYPKVFLEKFFPNFFWRRIINSGFGSFGSSSAFANIRKAFISENISNFLRVFRNQYLLISAL